MNAVISAHGVFLETEDAPSSTSTTTVNPGNQLPPGLHDYDVSPGLVGFLVTFGVAAALMLLLFGMTRRLRRVKHKEGANQQVSAVFDGEGPKRKKEGPSA